MRFPTLLLIALFVFLVHSSDFHPCNVHTVILQPHFGISATTKKLVDILQLPPLLTQKLYADVCRDKNSWEHDVSKNNMPQFICRQRYSVVEVYSKPREDLQSIQGWETMKNLSGEQLAKDFIKEFVMIEAGCEIFINLPSSRVGHSTLGKHETFTHPGVASLHGMDGSKREPSLNFTALLLQAFSGLQNNSVSNKTSPAIKNDFFRKGMYLNVEEEAIDTDANVSNVDLSEMDNEGEIIRLTSENFDLVPLVILDATLDPVMKIINDFPHE